MYTPLSSSEVARKVVRLSYSISDDGAALCRSAGLVPPSYDVGEAEAYAAIQRVLDVGPLHLDIGTLAWAMARFCAAMERQEGRVNTNDETDQLIRRYEGYFNSYGSALVGILLEDRKVSS